MTYGELHRQVNKIANYLVSLGLKKGDRVAILCDKTPELVVISLACAITGFILTPLNFKMPPAELEKVWNLTTPSVLVAHLHHFVEYIDLLEPLIPAENRIILTHLRSFGPRWQDVLKCAPNDSPPLVADIEDVVYFNFTSGTTGISKIAMTTGANLYWNTRGSAETQDLTEADIHLSMFPTYGHPHELWCRAIFLGGTMLMIDHLSPKYIANVISDYKVTSFMAVPSLMEMLVSIIEEDGHEFDFSHLRYLEAGGMHSTDGFTQRIRKVFESKNVKFLPVWGSTETAGIALCSAVLGERKIGSVGKPVKYYETKIINEQQEECKPGEVGELLVKGPGVVSGYYNNPEETQKSFHQGWYRTGDLMKYDEDKNYYFVYRRQGMMKVAGMKVSPQEIDNVLSLHPQIKEAVCVPAFDRLRGEVPKAIVVIAPGTSLSPSDIKKFCRIHLADYKIPRIIEYWPYLPKTVTGKIDIKKIKQLSYDGKKP